MLRSEVRDENKLVCSQLVFSYLIDQGSDKSVLVVQIGRQKRMLSTSWVRHDYRLATTDQPRIQNQSIRRELGIIVVEQASATSERLGGRGEGPTVAKAHGAAHDIVFKACSQAFNKATELIHLQVKGMV